MKVLMVITSHDQLGTTGRKTGFWLEELAAPYYIFKDSGAEVTLASPKGGRPPLDPKSNEPEFRTALTLRFENDEDAEAQLDKTVRLDSVKQEDFDTVFYPGGHGPMWDLAEDQDSIKLIESFLAAGKPIGIVCHSTGALRHVKMPDGRLLVHDKEVTGFTNGEEADAPPSGSAQSGFDPGTNAVLSGLPRGRVHMGVAHLTKLRQQSVRGWARRMWVLSRNQLAVADDVRRPVRLLGEDGAQFQHLVLDEEGHDLGQLDLLCGDVAANLTCLGEIT